MTSVTVGSRYQVVIPRKERERVHLKPNSKMQVDAHDGYLILQPMTGRKWRGIGSEIAGGEDAVDYVRKLRQEWMGRS